MKPIDIDTKYKEIELANLRKNVGLLSGKKREIVNARIVELEEVTKNRKKD